MADWSKEEIKDHLKEMASFSDFDPSALQEIAAACTVKSFAPNELVIREGPIEIEEWYFVLSGSLEAFHVGEHDEIYVLNTITSNQIFGENVIFGERDRVTSVRAKTTADILVVPKPLIDQLAETNPGAAVKLFHKLHAQTLLFLKGVNKSAMDLIKRQKEMGFFIINIVAFLSLYAIAVPYFHSIIKVINPIWISTPIIIVGVLLLIARLWVTKIPLSSIGIHTKHLGKSLFEAFLYSIAALALIIALKYILILSVSSLHDKPIFYTDRQHTFDRYGIWITNSQIFWMRLIYAVHAVFQEILARGSLQGSFNDFLSFKHKNFVAVVLASVVFASAHAFFGIFEVFAVFLPGLFWGWIYARQGNVFGAALSHILIGTCFLGFIGGF